MRICTVVGARPQFIKAAVVSPALKSSGVDEVLVHTGQHYDVEMSSNLFEELRLAAPEVNLGVGSGTHARQTADMLTSLESFLVGESRFDGLLVYGDTNSTLAGAMVAAKLGLPIFHVEAGLRSWNRRMPEELNRLVTDRLSSLMFCPTDTAVDNLAREGIYSGVVKTGDVMFESARRMATIIAEQNGPLPFEDLPDRYYLATVHRPVNVDNEETLKSIIDTLGQLELPVVFPVHPRTAVRLDPGWIPANVQTIAPASYGGMIQLLMNATAVLTDSGGIQKEAFWLGVRCLTLREETEWPETLAGGWNVLCGSNRDRIVEALAARPAGEPAVSDAGDASATIAAAVKEFGENGVA